MPKIKVSDYIAEFLRVQETRHVFEVAGGMITHMLDSLHNLGYTHIISVHHEQAAAFAADAYGRCAGRPSVAFATSGPGATNLLTGIGSCYFDSSPALFITGQVNVHEQKKDKKIRQLGFQETDIVSMAKPITKKAYLVERADELVSILTEAYALTMHGRPGPVLVDIPMNIQSAYIEVGNIEYISSHSQFMPQAIDQLASLQQAIQQAKKPLILAGNGIACAGVKDAFLQLVDRLHIPVVSSLMGIDLLPFAHPLRVGMIGSYGNRWANLAIGQADLLIVLGSRLDIRQTGADVAGFRGHKTIFHIDCDVGEINNRVSDCIPIVADINDFLQQANVFFDSTTLQTQDSWLAELNALKAAWPDIKELSGCKGINPNQFMHILSNQLEQCAAYLADVGNHQMWSAQSLEMHQAQRFLTTGGMGAMGFALPAAIGACLALDKQPVVVIVGDGAFQMNIQELQTVIRNKLPIKIIVMNNQALGMIRQFQDSYFEGRYQSTYWGYSAPDFTAIAHAYGLPAKTVSDIDAVDEAVAWIRDQDSFALLQVMIDAHTNVYPKIAFGKPITEMEPFASPIAMEGT